MTHPLSDSESLHEALRRKLKAFSLTYEQHQLMHRNQLGLVAQHIVQKRRLFTWMLAFAAVALAFQAARTSASTPSDILWLLASASLGFWAFRRYRNTSLLAKADADYQGSRDADDRDCLTLADELRLYCALDYDEHQAVHRNEDEKAAHTLIARRRTNITVMCVGVVVVSYQVFRRIGLEVWPFVVVLSAGGALGVLGDLVVIRRVQRLLAKHSSTTPLRP